MNDQAKSEAARALGRLGGKADTPAQHAARQANAAKARAVKQSLRAESERNKPRAASNAE